MIGTVAHLHNFLTALAFTILVETSVLLLIINFVLKSHNLNTVRITFIGILASASTLPYVSFVFPKLFDWSRPTWLLFAELFAVIIEAVLYRVFLKLDWKISVAVSLVCNIISYYLGHLLHSNGIWFYW